MTRKSRPAGTGLAALAGGMALALACGGCASIGPPTVARDRVDYITAVADSWKEQTLLNIVRMRYADAPSFVEVASVISAYQFQGQLSAAGQISSNLTNTIPSNLVTLGGNATYQDRPTITYTPVTGEKFANSLLRPIPPSAIFELIQAGYPADAILQMTTRAINGVYNRSSIGGGAREADPNFYCSMRYVASSFPAPSVCDWKSMETKRPAFSSSPENVRPRWTAICASCNRRWGSGEDRTANST